MTTIAVGYRKQLLDNNFPFIPQSMSTKTLPAGLSMLFYWPITYCIFYPIRFPIVIFSEKHHSVFRINRTIFCKNITMVFTKQKERPLRL